MHPLDPTRKLKAVLANPYGHASGSSYSPHYIQAYLHSSASRPLTNAQGYTLSSTYKPEDQHYNAQENSFQKADRKGIASSKARAIINSSHQPPPSSQWYQAGNIRCTYKGCIFMGSQKSLEIHRMDRHLIYPQGWVHRKRKGDWDADPSLKGKLITVQGTNISLDTPEILEAWLAERKRRWPSSSRIEEQKKKREEAAARGQLSIGNSGLLGKRKGRDLYADQVQRRPARKGWNGGVHGKSNPIDRSTASGHQALAFKSNNTAHVTTSRVSDPVLQNAETNPGCTSSSEDEDGPPEVASSKALPATVTHRCSVIPCSEIPVHQKPFINIDSETRAAKTKKARPQQPKMPLGPVTSRPTLLRNLLLPEIQATVSNLSQAIRFLVDNDFLIGVELEPGEASRKLIQVIES